MTAWFINRKYWGGYIDLSALLRLCVIPIVTTCILLAVSLIAANTAFILSAVLPVVPVVAAIVAAFIPAGVCHFQTDLGVHC